MRAFSMCTDDADVLKLPSPFIATMHYYVLLASWMLMSIALTLFNKWLLGMQGFHCPLTLSCLHMVGSFLAAIAMAGHRPAVQESRSPEYKKCASPSLEESGEDTKHLPSKPLPLPPIALCIAALYASSVTLRNAAFMHVSVATIQLLTALAPACVYVFSLAFGLQTLRLQTVIILVGLATGTALCVSGTPAASTVGMGLQIAGIVCETLKSVLTQVFVQKGSGLHLTATDALATISWPSAALTFVPACWFELDSAHAFLRSHSVWFPPALACNVGLAVLFNIAHLAVLKRFNALTVSLTGQLKSWALIVTSLVMAGESCSPRFALGGCLVVLSSAAYVFTRSPEDKAGATGRPQKDGLPSGERFQQGRSKMI